MALEEQGYILAKGDRRDFVIVDETGSIHSLGRQIRDIKAAELREFMKGIDRETLPTAAQAKDLQQQRQQQQLHQQEPAHQQPQQSEPASSNTSNHNNLSNRNPGKRNPINHRKPNPPTNLPNRLQTPIRPKPRPSEKPSPSARPRRAADSSNPSGQKWTSSANSLTARPAKNSIASTPTTAPKPKPSGSEQKEATAGFAGFMDSVQDFFNPARAAERKAERQRELQQHAARLKQERDDYVALIQKTNALEIHNREELHALRLHDLEVKGAEERDRYLREQE